MRQQFATDFVNALVTVSQIGAALATLYGTLRKVYLTVMKETA